MPIGGLPSSYKIRSSQEQENDVIVKQTMQELRQETIPEAGIAEAIAGSTGWFAVLDACDEPLVPAYCRTLGNSADCLYRGNASRDFWAIAPYLIELTSERWSWVASELGGKHWGILVRSQSDFETIRRHLRRFLKVKGPGDKELYFRFYDPRVLPTFLISSDGETVEDFFGPLDSMCCETEAGSFSEFQLATPSHLRESKDKSDLKLDTLEFNQRLVRRIGKALERTGRAVPHPLLSNQISLGTFRAKSYGMTNPDDVARYIETVCCYLGGFGERPDPIPVQECLRDESLVMAKRVQRLSTLVRDLLAK